MSNEPWGFQELVADAKTRVAEWTVEETRAKMDDGQVHHLVDVREESEFAAARLPGAKHIGKGILERDIAKHIPDRDAVIVCYCGGGYRSALAVDNLMKMGYTNAISMDGGFKGWREAGHPVDA